MQTLPVCAGYHTDGEASGQETSDPESPPDSEYEAPFAKGLLEARTGEELCSGGKRKAVSSPIGGKSKRQSLARGSKPTAPPKKPSPAAGGEPTASTFPEHRGGGTLCR